MLFKNISLIDDSFDVLHEMYVGVRQGVIDYISAAAPPDEGAYGRVVNGQDKLLISGFFNTHSHTAMSLLRGYGENLPLQEWLTTRIFPFEDRLTYNDIYWGTLLCCAEMLRYGIVSTTDMYMNGAALGDAFRDGGVKANLSVAITRQDDISYFDTQKYQETLEMIDKYHQTENGRLKVDFSLHAEYTNSERITRSIAEAAARHNLPMHVHVSETAFEVNGCRERHGGRTPVRYLADCGLFDVPTTAAHCVHLTDEDIALLAEKHVNVATCPRSNLKLASGIAPVCRMLKAGINVALATDSVSSNNNLNFIEEMRALALLQKHAEQNANALSPAQALNAATIAGAQAQQRPDCGALKLGNRADLVMLDLHQPHQHPAHDLLCNLLYAADGSDVVMTVVDGEVRYENGSWPHLDIERIYAETDSSVRRIISELQA